MTRPLTTRVLENACPECGADMVLRDSRYGLFYGCTSYPRCQATHGAHPNGAPLGVPANTETKEARMQAHDAFDKLWKAAGATTTRREAYSFLRSAMGLPGKECHIGKFSKEQCEQVCIYVEERLATT